MPPLTSIEVRVLGSLVEKQITTPEYYPLTLNALTLACNQRTNRNPVTAFTDAEVDQALDSLREKNLAYVFFGSNSRVPKYKHVADNLHLSPPELAVMCVLMLSGPQTIGEIRGRASRLHEFSSLEEVEETLRSLSGKESEALVIRLPRQSGQKEARFAHLLSGEVNVDEVTTESPASKETRSSSNAARSPNASERVASLEQKVETLSSEVESLRRQLEEFRKQFE